MYEVDEVDEEMESDNINAQCISLWLLYCSQPRFHGIRLRDSAIGISAKS